MGMFRVRKYEESLTQYTEAQKLITSELSSSCAENLLYVRALCCIELGYKTKAEKLLKEIKKYGGSSTSLAELKALEDDIRAMTFNKKTKMKVKTVSRCWNPFCNEMEKKIGEFKKCSRCDVA